MTMKRDPINDRTGQGRLAVPLTAAGASPASGGALAGWLRTGVLLLCALVIGWWARGNGAVHAADGDFQFQVQGSELLIYSAAKRTIYVYKGSEGGNDAMQCSHKFVIRDNGQVDRRGCEMGSLTR
ncbi:MAG TPA: hypothetical protein VGD59_09115 [Acidisarcina sp.]